MFKPNHLSQSQSFRDVWKHQPPSREWNVDASLHLRDQNVKLSGQHQSSWTIYEHVKLQLRCLCRLLSWMYLSVSMSTSSSRSWKQPLTRNIWHWILALDSCRNWRFHEVCQATRTLKENWRAIGWVMAAVGTGETLWKRCSSAASCLQSRGFRRFWGGREGKLLTGQHAQTGSRNSIERESHGIWWIMKKAELRMPMTRQPHSSRIHYHCCFNINTRISKAWVISYTMPDTILQTTQPTRRSSNAMISPRPHARRHCTCWAPSGIWSGCHRPKRLRCSPGGSSDRPAAQTPMRQVKGGDKMRETASDFFWMGFKQEDTNFVGP